MSNVPNQQLITKRSVGATISFTRPNNVTAYAVGQVYGPAADARIQIPVPALPADAAAPTFSSIQLYMIQQVSPAQAAVAFQLVLFSAQPATVLGDQATFGLSDADIGLVLWNGVNVSTNTGNFQTGNGSTSTLNGSAGLNGRRVATSPLSLTFAAAGFNPSISLWAYLWVTSAYTPLAQEVFTISPSFIYSARQAA